jgi:hypothetical protein
VVTRQVRARSSAAALLTSLLALPALAGCTEPASDAPAIETVDWVERTVPKHPGFLDRATETRDTRPAIWTSTDGTTWAPVRVSARTYWGQRAILNSVACSRERIAVVGARSGGAHGNPRVTTFYLDDDGILRDVEAPFVQYGGVAAVGVGPISGGRDGWTIAGNRTSGPAVWVTDDPRKFTLVEAEPGLTDDGDLESLAQAAVPTDDGWILVGAGAPRSQAVDYDPLAWTSTNGTTWKADPMPSRSEPEEVHRVIRLDVAGSRLLGVGLSGEGFAAWKRDQDGWRDSTRFGAQANEGRAAPYVTSLTADRTDVFAAVSTGRTYQLWSATDGSSWRRIDVPIDPTVAGDHAMAVAARNSTPDSLPDLILVADDGDGGRVWTTTISTQATPR